MKQQESSYSEHLNKESESVPSHAEITPYTPPSVFTDHFAEKQTTGEEKDQNHERNPKSRKINLDDSYDHEQPGPSLRRASG